MCTLREKKESTVAAWKREDLKKKGTNERFQETDLG